MHTWLAMNPFYIVFAAVGILLLRIAFTSIGIKEALIAVITGKPVPPYFELFPQSLPGKFKEYLILHDPYFSKLSPMLQRSFGSRVMRFMASKEFKARQGLKVTREMKLVVASAAVRITFGLEDYLFSSFHTILLYPDEFFSGASKQQVKGETHGNGVIAFSWKDLKFGMTKPYDAINLGYHEFAHALFIEHFFATYEDSFKQHYREWLLYIKRNESLKMVREKGIFNDYASVNEIEFFAVALENFFERPAYFKRELPRLYDYMTKILCQDPTTM